MNYFPLLIHLYGKKMNKTYDPTLGKVNYVNTPYQFWEGNAGIKEAGGLVEFIINEIRFTTPILADGSWRFSPELFFNEGVHNIAFHYIDAASNHGDYGQFSLEVDTTPPEKPVIQLVEDNVGSSQGPLYSGAYTDDTRPKLVGFAEPGSVVRLWKNNQVIATTTAQDNGRYTFEVELGDGTHHLFTTASDRHEQTSPPSDTFVININVNNDPVPLPSLSMVEDNFGPVKKMILPGEQTDDQSPKFSGVAPNELKFVRIYDGAVEVARVSVVDGKWSWEGSLSQFSAGNHSITLRGEDANQNLSDPTSAFNLNVTTSAPVTPAIIDAWDNVGIEGAVGNKGKTDDTTPTLRGTGEPGSEITLQYRLAGATWVNAGKVTVDANGRWELTSPELAGEGTWEFRARAANGHGNSTWATKFVLNVEDLTPVTLPTLTEVYDNFGAVKKSLTNGEITDDRNPVFSGRAAADVKFVRIYDGVTEVARVAVVNGKWTWEGSASQFSAGTHSISLRGEDANKNLSDLTTVFNLNVTTTAPVAPTITDAWDNVGVEGAIGNKGNTDDTTPTLRGTGEPGSEITLQYRLAGATWVNAGKVIVDANGHWELTSPELASGGTWEFRARAANGHGNSAWATKFVLNVEDLTPVTLPTLTEVYDNFGAVKKSLTNGEITDDRNPVFSGRAAADVKFVRIYDGVTEVARVAVVNGKWTWEGSASQFSAGTHSISLRGEDANKNLSDLTTVFNLNVTTTAPVAPTITDAWDNVGVEGAIGNKGNTDDTTPTLRGTGEAGSVINVQYRLAGSSWVAAGKVTVDANGHWELTSPELAGGGAWEFRARAVNGHGNSPWTSKFVLHVEDSVPVSQPVIHDVYDNFGAVKKSLISGETTDDRNPIFSGNVAADVRFVRIYDGLQEVGRVAVSGNQWTWEGSVQQFSGGSHAITVRGENANGKLSDPSDIFILKVVTTVPGAPVINYAEDNVGSWQGKISNGSTTDDRTPTLYGEGVAGSVIKVEYSRSSGSGFNQIGSAIVGADGKWSWNSPQLSENGNWYFRAKASNGYGDSLVSNNFSVKIIPTPVPVNQSWDFSDGTMQGWFAAGLYAGSNNLEVKRIDGNFGVNVETKGPNGYYGTVMRRDFEVVEGQTYNFSFDVKRLNTTGVAPSIGLVVDTYTTVIPQYAATSSWQTLRGTYVATATKTINLAIFNGQTLGNGNDFAIDNIRVTSSPAIQRNEVLEFNDNSLSSGNAVDEYALNATLKAATHHGVIDAADDTHDVISIMLGDVLQQGTKSLFIEDGYIQQMVQGDRGDVLNLESLQDENGNWVKTEGNVTVAGKVYEVYQHTGQQAELLIQQDLTVNIH
jgi:hypothetical protein